MTPRDCNYSFQNTILRIKREMERLFSAPSAGICVYPDEDDITKVQHSTAQQASLLPPLHPTERSLPQR